LNEILKISARDLGFSLSQFDLAKAKQVSVSEGGIPILRIPTIDRSALLMFALKVDDSLISQLVGEFHKIFGEEYFIIGRSWTNLEFQGRGYMTALYSLLVRNLKIKILSDKEQSPAAIRLWKTLAARHKVKVLVVRTGEKINLKDFSDGVYTDSELDADNFRLVLFVISDVGKGIIDEYVKYTHRDNLGKFE